MYPKIGWFHAQKHGQIHLRQRILDLSARDDCLLNMVSACGKASEAASTMCESLPAAAGSDCKMLWLLGVGRC